MFPVIFGYTHTRRNVYSCNFLSVKFKVKKKRNVYSPWHFQSSYKVIFGHLYSVKLIILIIKPVNQMVTLFKSPSFVSPLHIDLGNNELCKLGL